MCARHAQVPLAAVILAGGKASRLGCVDKALIEIDGRTLLSRSALARGVAALPDLPADTHVAVLAGDLLGITAGTVTRLRSTLDEDAGLSGALLVDENTTRSGCTRSGGWPPCGRPSRPIPLASR